MALPPFIMLALLKTLRGPSLSHVFLMGLRRSSYRLREPPLMRGVDPQGSPLSYNFASTRETLYFI